ncbi:MAG TPA: hypothetical protein VJ023_16350 [Pyrinomonadaceae bacterium]|nr:hypothetical protein [Pyrinomonadaceae bacterium]
MTVHLDHLMVPSRDKVASAKLLAELLGVPWSETVTSTGTSQMVISGRC